MNLIKTIFFTAILSAVFSITALAQANGSIYGVVTDVNGAVVQGATVTAIGPDGKEKAATTNKTGEFTIANLAAASYIVRVIAPNFALFENPEVAVTSGKKSELNVSLTIQAIVDTVEVGKPDEVSTDPNNNASATVLSEKELEALPDDPDELEAALQALAGPGAGPNGGQIYIDGFTGGRLPPKEAIREIRINNNPFSAEFERLGFGRIEILTRPGSDKFRGNAFFNFNDESLNSRNPFSINRAPSQMRAYGGNFSGPIQKGKSSFFFDISERDNDSNAVVNAIVLDSGLNPVIFQEEFTVPTKRFSFSPRVDFAINDKNTLVARYEYSRNTSANQGIGGTSLPSRAYESSSFDHEIRLTETMIVNAKTVNETRFSYDFSKREQVGDNTIPTISVGAAFTGGGAQVGNSFNRNKSWEISNNTTTSFGKASQHAVKFGVRVRGVNIDDFSQSGFGGTFTFTEINNYIATIQNTSIPTQFSITTGDPLATVSRTDVGAFITDDWRLKPGLTLSLGLRYENQTNIKSNLNFAPRVAIAWSPGAGGAKAPKTVFRAGAGIFYDRVSEGLTLTANRFNGTNQLNFLVNSLDPDPARRAIAQSLLDQAVFTVNGVTNVPTAAQIAAVLPGSSTIRTLDSQITAPYTMQAAFSVERQLPWRTTMSASFITSRSLHTLRARNVNAPICPTQINCLNAPRPNPALGNIYEYESSGIQSMQQLVVNFRSTLTQNISLFGNYRLGFAKGDSDGTGSFPAYTYDLTGEYGRSSGDIRNNFTIGGNINLPWQFSLSPFVTAGSGRPFNIYRGVDLNGDSLLTERPTFAELGARCSALNISSSWCNVSGRDPNAIIPRNWGEGPGFVTVNLRVSKNFGFGGGGGSTVAANQQGNTTTGGNNRGGGGNNRGGGNRGGGGARGGGGGFGGGPMMMGGFGGGDRRKPYNLNLGINFQNLFNTVNLGTPVGNLASSRFGQSTSTGGSFGGFGGGGGGTANRRIDLSARFSW
jgi:hypothetical protein